MAIIIVTNRNLNRGRSDELTFGDGFNSKGPLELRIATAKKQNKKWKVDVLSERNISAKNLPSSKVFQDFRSNLIKNKKNCVFFVHGFNQSLLKNLNKCAEIESYGVDVVAFSWPSNPGGFKLNEYRKARRAAEISAPALERVLEKMIGYYREYFEGECDVCFNMIYHSLGNYLFQNYTEKRSEFKAGKIFDNLILHQADVDSVGHGDWISKLKISRRTYITHNENDKTLDISDIVNPNRLGNTSDNTEVPTVKYIDFTDARHVRRSHRLWQEARKNKVIEKFFDEVFNGKRAENITGISFDESSGMFKVK